MVSTRRPRAPGPPGHWLLGWLPALEAPLDEMLSGSNSYGDVTRFRIGPPLIGVHAHLLRHPDLIKHVLVDNPSNYVKGRSNDCMLPVLGQGLLTAEGPVWAEQRKSIQASFRMLNLVRSAEKINQCLDRHVERWAQLASLGSPTDIAQDMLHLTVEIAARVLFEIDLSAESHAITADLATLEADVMYRVRKPFAAPRWLPTRRQRDCRRAHIRMLELVSGIIDHVRSQPSGCGGLLEPMVRAGGGVLGYRHLQQQVMTILLASHETTASALTWTWYLISQNPEAELGLHAEIERVLNGRPPSGADLAELEYTRQCILEALRIYPPGWSLERRAVAADVIAGYRIEAGDMLLLSAFVAQRNPEYWPDPERFDPTRFAADRLRELPAFAYFPFGGGHRRCVGADFALTQMRIIIPRVAQRWRLQLVDGHPVVMDPMVTLRAKHGMRMHVIAR